MESANTTSAPTTSAEKDKIYRVMVNGIRGEKVTIDLCNTKEQMKSMTVRQLKEKIAQKLPDTARLDHMRLIFRDKVLEEDTDLLSEYRIQHMSVIHVVFKVPGGGPPLPSKGDGGMGDKDDKHRTSMERLMMM